MIPSVAQVGLGAQVFKTTVTNWVNNWTEKLSAYLDPDYWLFKDTEHYRWPWPTSDSLKEIEFRIALNKVLASSNALEKSIQDWNNLQGITKR
jgi:hypothetical protein